MVCPKKVGFCPEIANFEDSFEIKEGKKYTQVGSKNGGVWGFIVKEDGPVKRVIFQSLVICP